MVNFIGGIFYFLLALGILVTIHELGHFLAARACKVKVLRFSLGFGPVIYKKTGKDGCEYAVSAIPLGGYVKMEGENNPAQGDKLMPSNEGLSPDSFKAKPVWQRAIIIFAGPFFNIALAVILFTIVNMSGISERYAVVGDVAPMSIAQEAGFKTFDRIEAVEGKSIETWSDFVYTLVEYTGSNKILDVVVKSDMGKGAARTLPLSLKDFTLNRNESPLDVLGLKICFGNITNTLGAVVKNSPADKAGLKVGDKIVLIDGQEVDSWFRIQETIADSECRPMELVVERDGVKYSAIVVPELKNNSKAKKAKPFVGIAAKVEPLEGLSRMVSYGPVEAFGKAIKDAASMSKLVVVSAYKLINGSISADNISGPIAIAKGAQESAQFGLIIFISFLAAISVNLGILNLIPIPVLDGGQLLFLAYEAIMHREPSARTQAFLTSIGAAVLLTLTVFAVFNDIKGL